MVVDALRTPFYSSRHTEGSDVQGNQLDLGNVGSEDAPYRCRKFVTLIVRYGLFRIRRVAPEVIS